jgi:hypothetical protein
MMRVTTVLNQRTEFKRFVLEGSRLDEYGRVIVKVRPRKNSRVVVVRVPGSTGQHHLTDIYPDDLETRRAIPCLPRPCCQVAMRGPAAPM